MHAGECTTERLRARIQQLERQLRELYELRDTIAQELDGDVSFNSRDLWAHRDVSPALAAVFERLHIRNAQQLGKRLRQLRGDGLERIGDDWCGACWVVR